MLGAANPNGIADDYMQQFTAKYVSPIVNGADPGMPFRSQTDLVTKNWNIVYVPYCTGDVHMGNQLATYLDPRGVQPPLPWAPRRLRRTRSPCATGRTRRFPNIDRLLVTRIQRGRHRDLGRVLVRAQRAPAARGRTC